MSEPRPLDWGALREVMVRYHQLLVAHRAQLNDLNVFPVADSDTGTNLALTLQIVVDRLDEATDMTAVCDGVARGSLLGARGSSGVIVAQFLGAFASIVSSALEIEPTLLASALEAGSTAARAAVVNPVEGTILTVAQEAAEAATASSSGGMEAVLSAAVRAGAAALARTRYMLPELQRAGVVDAGGQGFQLFLEGLREVLLGTPVSPLSVDTPGPRGIGTENTPRFEVIVRIVPGEASLESFREAWAALGDDSTVVVASDGLWVGHIHTDNADETIAAARAAGSVRDLEVTDLRADSRPGWAPNHGS